MVVVGKFYTKDRLNALTDIEWEQIEGLALAYLMANDGMDIRQAEVYAILDVVDKIKPLPSLN